MHETAGAQERIDVRPNETRDRETGPQDAKIVILRAARAVRLADIEKAQQASVAVHDLEGENEKKAEVGVAETAVGTVAFDLVFQVSFARARPDVMIGGGACAYPAFQIRLERRVERWRKGTPFAAEGIGKESLPRRIAKRNEPRIFTRWLAQAQGKIEAALRRIDAEKADGKVAPSGATFTVSPSCTACRTVAMPSPKGGSAAFAKGSRVLRMARGMCPRCSDPGAAISIFVRRQQVSLLQL